MKKLKKDKVKRSRIILSSIITLALALLSLGFGAYFGYVTLNINYVTIGTMTPMVGGLLVVAGFFIFFGCIGGMLAIKELYISFKNEDKFSAHKGALISAIVYYIITAIICIVGLIMGMVSYLPSSYTSTILALCVFAFLLCAGAFYCVFKELKEHKKKTKKKNQQKLNKEWEDAIANLNLSPKEIQKLSNTIAKGTMPEDNENCKQNDNIENIKKEEITKTIEDDLDILGRKRNIELQNKPDLDKKEVDFIVLSEKLMQLEELRKAGLINDQEYQSLKAKCMG